MGYRSRILPPEEWSCLAGMDLAKLLPLVTPGTMQIVVVETDEQIVATWALWSITHLEGLWIHPDFRNAAVGRRLWTTMRAIASAQCSWAMTTAENNEIAEMLRKVGAQEMPAKPFIISFHGAQTWAL